MSRSASAASTALRAWPITTTTGRAFARQRRFGDPPHDRLAVELRRRAWSPPNRRRRESATTGRRPARSRRPQSSGARGCGREAISIRRPPTPIARMSASRIGTPASTRCSTQSKPFSFGERAQPGAPMIGVPWRSAEQQQIAGIDRHAEPLDAPADRLDRGRNHVAAVGDRRGAEHDQRVGCRRSAVASALASGPVSCGDALLRRRCARRSAPAAPRARARSWRRSRASGPAAVVETTPTRIGRNGVNRRSRPAAPRRAPPRASRAGTANGMILTVATMSPSATAR